MMPPLSLPIVFLGPSLPVSDARRFLAADYRPPIRRGDLDDIPAGATVGIVDGVFAQELAISPREVREASERGVRILGASSMGALRAAEVPQVEGVGRIFQLFKEGRIRNDDEVALVFDPETLKALSEPLVNVRYSIEQLQGPGTIERSLGRRILMAANRLFYAERVYPRILAAAGIEDDAISRQLTAMLRSHDLKREDAVTLLEQIARQKAGAPEEDAGNPGRRASGEGSAPPGMVISAATRAASPISERAGQVGPDKPPADAPVFLWEYGDSILFRDLLTFLKLTGRFQSHALRAASRYVLAGNSLDTPCDSDDWDPTPHVQSDIVFQRFQWGWWSAEEARVTLLELGFDMENLVERVEEEVAARRRLMALAREASGSFLEALRAELLVTDLALKREAARYGSLLALAAYGKSSGTRLRDDERRQSQDRLCELLETPSWSHAQRTLESWGVSKEESTAFAEQLSFARRGGCAVLDAMAGKNRPGRPSKPTSDALPLRRSMKPAGERRFCLPLATAVRHAERLKEVVGITRVGVITGLSTLGLPNVQAYRPGGRWSSTIGSGKGTNLSGATAGAIMEEVEKWAQEQFDDQAEATIRGSFSVVSRTATAVDPAILDLPHDTLYRSEQELGWVACPELMTQRQVLVPLAALTSVRQPEDIFYSPRLAKKVFSTSGLASGFTLEEALTHALCEVVERHATKLAELSIHNPGAAQHSYRTVNSATLPKSMRGLLRKVAQANGHAELVDITCELRVPTFWANIFLPHQGAAFRRAPGFAAHPDPEVAATMALLEAGQTVLSNIAGGREDLAIKSRSLGRHERTRAISRSGMAMLSGRRVDPVLKDFATIEGFTSRDARQDVNYVLDCLWAAGIDRVFAFDLSSANIRPARVVRVIIPGLETVNPLRTGLRARVSLLKDLLPVPASHAG